MISGGLILLDALGAAVPADHAALGIEEVEGIPFDPLDQEAQPLLAILQRALGGALLGLIVEHQHHAADLSAAVLDGRGAVTDGPLAAVLGDEQRVIGKAHHHALAQDPRDRRFGGPPRLFINDVEHLGQRASLGLRL